MKIHNFSAGPSILPQEVFEKASKAIINFNRLGLSILEISHRSQEIINLFEKTIELVKKIASIGKDYEVLFLQGGANLQFVMVPYNLMKKRGIASYLDTGIWSFNAIQEAKKIGNVHIIASSRNTNYDRIPKKFSTLDRSDYLHLTTNNTIVGTQIKNFTQFKGILIADMSSDIFSRKIDFNKFSLIYASAQKNIGTAGITLIIIKKSLLKKSQRIIPSYLDYSVHLLKNRMFNTPNVFGVYIVYKTLSWLDQIGGLNKIEKINEEKANLIYGEIDRNPLFQGFSTQEDRSNMNATFFLVDESQKNRFDLMCKKEGISGLNGHRYLGGYRASIYNAMPIKSIKLLIEIMKEFERTA